MSFEISSLLPSLAARRPIFHSEADFQHELAWSAREQFPSMDVRLEYPLSSAINGAVDILLRVDGYEFGLELKYLCQPVETNVAGEAFSLRAQGAQDIRRYDSMKDIARMERFVSERPGASACVLVLTNDPQYWRGPQSDEAGSAAFSLREGRRVTGRLEWGDRSGPGSRRNRETPIEISRAYDLHWRDFSRVDGRFGVFRILQINVEKDDPV